MKQQTTMGLSKDARVLIDALSDKLGITNTAVFELAVRCLAEKQGIDWTAEKEKQQ
jgi:hypothetical protein